ncbi:polyamine transporter subunit; membrane component of ABC superfamily [Mesotoga infera]|uniref:Polyamine transporter subunit membrane component of ABC superfamily n=1 Tax=Mesotoga infera TaxID=1236046 RepID=A0A7Z7PR00_9BACT|nr:ABC transporter permease [Mesotoga infera]SSC12996.1 polyamine transporter subunit; membrane component of ABC superfamily [Mesotoga infera]
MKSKRDFTGFMVSMPGVLWLTVFFLIPYIIIIIYSFLTSGIYGGVELPFTLEAYSKMLVNAGYWQILWRTVWISIIATSICVGLGLPAAYFIATSKHRNIFLTLVIIPFWTNFLVRIFGWMVILGRNGLINSFLQLLGLKEPLSFMYTPGAVILVIVYMYLPYMILPLYSAIEKFDFRLIEAAMDLGAKRTQAIWKVLIPSIRGGIGAGVILVFIPALGSYAIPDLVGGADGAMLGNLIARQLTVARNWPSSSAISMIFLLISTLGLLVYLRINKVQNKRRVQVSEIYMKEEEG